MVGDAVAAVAAVDEETAERACELIEVDYEPLPRPDVDRGVARRIPRCASTSTATGRTSTRTSRSSSATSRRRSPAPISCARTSSSSRATRTCRWSSTPRSRTSGPDGKLTLWSSTQTPHYVHRLLAKILDLPAAHIRVIAAPVGGGFGGKLDPFAHEIAACKLSQLTGPPGEDRAHARGGLLRPPRPAPRADVDQDGVHEATATSPARTSRRGSTAAPTAPTAWRRRSTRA